MVSKTSAEGQRPKRWSLDVSSTVSSELSLVIQWAVEVFPGLGEFPF